MFDPLEELVVQGQKQKKKATGQRLKPRTILTVMMPEILERVPQKAARKKLKDSNRIKKLEFRRNMTPLQVQNTIVRGFRHLGNIIGYTLVSGNQSGYLLRAADQKPDGNTLIDVVGQASLYICEKSAEVTTSPFVDVCACQAHFLFCRRVKVVRMRSN